MTSKKDLRSLIEFVEEYANQEELASPYGVRAILDEIEKDLNALEIIKTKKVDTNHLWSLIKWNDDERALAEYNKYIVEQYELTEREFKLLKEMLNEK